MNGQTSNIRKFLSFLKAYEESSGKKVAANTDHPLRNHAAIGNLMDKVDILDAPDKCVWMSSADGTFSTKSAFLAIRLHGVHRPSLLKIWNHTFNPRASLFGWRILHRAVPTDDRISYCGIYLVSSYSCCSSPSTEDFNRLFLKGDLAIALWDWARPLLNGQVPKIVRWTPPKHGVCLSVDGACKGNPDSLLAEVRALTDGLRLAALHGFHITTVHSDSLLFVQSFIHDKCPSWKCSWWWNLAHSLLLQMHVSMDHVFREANRVADALASHACLTQQRSIFSSSVFPTSCKGPVALDKSGLPSIRLPQSAFICPDLLHL
ncbi:hypothetical protein Taro_012363 [Colocasia esculenta]|uniref:RNase H type-1 domain-containing protein n=1 Tax=Colocasia esculenta TaxID=4460 RepID=A0A843UDE2_COLES|nr:hypothetical protein [Colocasia esculenta]